MVLTGTRPHHDTLRLWYTKDGWRAAALEFDRAQHELISPPVLPASPEAIEQRRATVFHAKEELLEIAQDMIKIVKAWGKSPKESLHIGGARDAQTLVHCTIECIKESEVLSGRVSDRVAEEKKVTVVEVKAQAKEKADKLLERLAAVRQVERERSGAAH